MREETREMARFIQASIEEVELRSGKIGIPAQGMRRVLALLWSAYDEVQLIDSEIGREPIAARAP